MVVRLLMQRAYFERRGDHETGPWALFAVFLLAGCAQAPVPPAYFYRIYVEAPDAIAIEAHLPGVLVVRRFLADGLVSERSVVYGEGAGPNSLQQYHYHSWTDHQLVCCRSC